MGSRYLVLLVEDDSICRKLFSRYLIHAGYEVVAVENGQMALDCFQQAKEGGQRIACVVTDVKMPIMDGLALARVLRQIASDLPIVFLTGDPHDPLLQTEMVIEKPSQLHRLAHCLKEILNPRD